MARPGVEIVSRAQPPARGAPSDTGVWFVAGLTAKGRTDEAVLVRNMDDYVSHFGDRVSYGLVYDALETFFREGGTKAYVGRVVGPAAAYDTVTLNDAGASPSLTVRSLGQYDSGLSVQVIAGDGAGQFKLVITENGTEVERSYNLDDVEAAVTWSSSSEYVEVIAAGANDPAVVAATPLAGGTDDRAAVTDTERQAALARFTRELGPGQVSYPGATTTTMHVALLDHAKVNNRVALLDAADTASDTTLRAAADAIRADGALDEEADERGGLLAPWVIVPGALRGTTRTVPPSGLVAGLMARSDSTTGNPNVPAAGRNGESRYALGVSQAPWTDAVREALNEDGVNVLRTVYGGVRLYGYRTLSDPVAAPGWNSLAAARLRMAIENEAYVIGEEFLFSQLDGKGRKIAEFNGALTGMLTRYYNLGALYGDTADEAFVVDTGAAVNTPTSLAANELRAVLGIRTSPFAELVFIEVVKVPITESL